MSSLTDIDKLHLEKILEMGHGSVSYYSNEAYVDLFSRHKIDTYEPRYQFYGEFHGELYVASNAKIMRAFWKLEADEIVAPVLEEILIFHKEACELDGRVLNMEIFDKCRAIVARLGGKTVDKVGVATEDIIRAQEFRISNLDKLPIESAVIEIVQQRLAEAHAALQSRSYLSVIFMCGSVLEGVLFGVAKRHPREFNRALKSPKNFEGKVKPLPDWTLAQLIDVACEAGFLKLDIGRFSHELRDFRNYIHPYKQLESRFFPDEQTAKICFQVLESALANLAGER